MILTGLSVVGGYGLIAGMGVGFIFTVGAGVMVQTGTSNQQYSAIAYMVRRVGAATLSVKNTPKNNCGAPICWPVLSTLLIVGLSQAMTGGSSFVGSGYMTFSGCSIGSSTGIGSEDGSVSRHATYACNCIPTYPIHTAQHEIFMAFLGT